MMLGSNDLKETFHASARQIADGAAALVEVIQDFTAEKQGSVPDIILVSPPEIGEGICRSPFYGSFTEEAIKRSREFPQWYRMAAEKYHCIFFDAAEYIKPSKEDSLHLSPEGHARLAEELAKVVREFQ